MDLTADRAKLKELYMPGTEDFVLVDVPKLPFAMVDGQGSPEYGAGAAAIKCLFATIYPIRRAARSRLGKAFVEPPVEFLHLGADPRDLATGKREEWRWRAMVTLPEWTDEAMFADAVAQARRQPGGVPDTLRMELFEEGRCAQIMHVGRPDSISGRLDQLYREFLPRKRLTPAGAYHEIYLDDWSRVAPDRRRLVLRQPVRAAS